LDRREVKPGYLDTSASSIKIHISELKIGMFVSKLDRDWQETPFLMQGFMVESLDDIDIVAEYSQHVWIDEVREVWVSPEERGMCGPAIPKTTRYVNKVDAKQEHAAAMGVFREAHRLTKSLP
jgi:hypothetical protein